MTAIAGTPGPCAIAKRGGNLFVQVPLERPMPSAVCLPFHWKEDMMKKVLLIAAAIGALAGPAVADEVGVRVGPVGAGVTVGESHRDYDRDRDRIAPPSSRSVSRATGRPSSRRSTATASRARPSFIAITTSLVVPRAFRRRRAGLEPHGTGGLMVRDARRRRAFTTRVQDLHRVERARPGFDGRSEPAFPALHANSCFSISWTGILTRSLCSSPWIALRTAAE